MQNDSRSECQVCGRQIKSKSGVIAHHGYTRPGHGWQTSSCFGARHVPYSEGHDALDYAIESVTTYAARQQAEADALRAVPPAQLVIPARRDAWGRTKGEDISVDRPAGFNAAAFLAGDSDGMALYPMKGTEEEILIWRATYRGAYAKRLWSLVAECLRQRAAAHAELVFLRQRRADWVAPVVA